jgi:hypothetical protein
MGNLKGRKLSHTLHADGRIILKLILKKQGGRVDWIHLVWDRNHWWALVNTVLNLRVPQKLGNFLSS